MDASLWARCARALAVELPEQQFNTWVRPLQAIESDGALKLLAPNAFVVDWIQANLLDRIGELLRATAGPDAPIVTVEVGSRPPPVAAADSAPTGADSATQPGDTAPGPARGDLSPFGARMRRAEGLVVGGRLNPDFTFETFVVGKSNQLAKAAALQVGENPGRAYNPLFIYGGVGLGKTHLMHAVGHAIRARSPQSRIAYVHSERFVGDMVKALQHNQMNDFKTAYRSLDALLIDDIQFFAGKDRSQEEFFHTFNALLEGQQQVIVTCDRYPKEVAGLEERLKSRFGWGLTVAIEPPELEMRVAILQRKAEAEGAALPDDVAFFIAKNARANVRELEGALRKVIAYARFSLKEINVALAREALRDLLSIHNRHISVENIQKTVGDFYKIKVADMYSKKRPASIAHPRQVAMYLAKELTKRSLPEIGELFGGRDHTTVLHAVRKIGQERTKNAELNQQLHVLEQTLKG